MENYDGTIKDLYIKSNFLENSSKCQKYNNLKQNFEQMNFGQEKYAFKKEVRKL